MGFRFPPSFHHQHCQSLQVSCGCVRYVRLSGTAGERRLIWELFQWMCQVSFWTSMFYFFLPKTALSQASGAPLISAGIVCCQHHHRPHPPSCLPAPLVLSDRLPGCEWWTCVTDSAKHNAAGVIHKISEIQQLFVMVLYLNDLVLGNSYAANVSAVLREP